MNSRLPRSVLVFFVCVVVFATTMGVRSARAADPPPHPSSSLAAPSLALAPAPPVLTLPITPRVVRSAVHAAFRAARLASDDAIDGLSSRARWTGLVPEIRLRATRLWDDSARVDVPDANGETWRTSQTAAGNLWLEARATFRLERLLFADEEIAVLRLRLAQSETAQRLASRVVDALAAWQRAWVESKAAPVGSVAALESALRLSELEATLDALTGGWFSSWRGREVR